MSCENTLVCKMLFWFTFLDYTGELIRNSQAGNVRYFRMGLEIFWLENGFEILGQGSLKKVFQICPFKGKILFITCWLQIMGFKVWNCPL